MKWLAHIVRFGLIAILMAAVIGVSSLVAQEDTEAPATQLDTFLDKLAEDDLFSGAALVARDGEILLSEGYGIANLDWDVPNTPDTKFRIGSITKQFAAMTILLLQEQGKLTIYDLICTYIEDCPETWADITIEQLMTHTSGLPSFTDQPDFQQIMMLPSSLTSIINRFRELPLDFQPGEDWYYSNSGYILLGHIINEASGQSYKRFMQENIFDPLGMADTGYDDNSRVIKNRAVGYQDANRIAQYIDMGLPGAAGAMYSTVGDLYTWITALMDGQVVPPTALDAMWDASVPIPEGDGAKYAYGLVSYTLADHAVIGHDGGINGFVSTLNYFPDEKVTIILLSNWESSGLMQIVDSSARILFDIDG